MKAVRTLLISILLPGLFYSCDKTENNYGNLQLTGTIPGGCATAKTKSGNSNLIEKDTVTFTVNNGELNLLVGFNGTCCGEYGTSSAIKNDTIFVKVKATQIGMCDCICYYTYNYRYEGITKSYSYSVNIDDYKLFEGLIEP
jgi:hypothetical protein